MQNPHPANGRMSHIRLASLPAEGMRWSCDFEVYGHGISFFTKLVSFRPVGSNPAPKLAALVFAAISFHVT